MEQEMFHTRTMGRRNFIKGTTAVGAGLIGLGSLLAACDSPTSASSGPATITVTDMPAESDKAGLAAFKQQVQAFQKQFSQYKIVGHNYYFDSKTYYARFAGGQAENAVRVYYTEPQYMINHHFVADITDQIKKWEHFKDLTPGALNVVTGPQGHIYGFPIDGYKLALVYNRKLFQKAGLDPDKPPQTWDEFMGYAKQLTGKGVSGFMELTTNNQGGWHYTNWLYTAGGKVEDMVDGKMKCVVNSPTGVKTLQMYKDMRWRDKSIGDNVIVSDTYHPLGQGKVAMVIGGSDELASLINDFKLPLDTFGVGPMPTNGGNGCLGGGNIWIFNPKCTPEQISGGVEWVKFKYFDMKNFEDDLKSQKAQGKAIGFPDNAAFGGQLLDQRMAILKKYANIPEEMTRPYYAAKQEIVPEPTIQSQTYYALMDPVVQKMLSDPNADPQKELDTVAQTFQDTIDQATM